MSHAYINPDHCYWCRNGVTPDEVAGKGLLSALFPVERVEAVRAQLLAEGKDPANAPILLQRERGAAA